MRKLFFLLLLALLYGCTPKITQEQSHELLKLYKAKNFFRLEELMSKLEFDDEKPDLLLYTASIDYAFNHPEKSNRLIEVLLKKYPEYFNDTITKDLYVMQSANAYRMQDYKSALYADSIIVNKYGKLCDSSELETLKDDISIFRSIQDVPKMELIMAENSQIPMSRDIAGMQNISVQLQKDSLNFVFDAGAAFSVIMESVAMKNGVKMLNNKVWTGTGNSKKVEGHMGLMDIRLGALELKNVAFLVLPDSLLTFAEGFYMMKGIIGFPIMYAFKEFTIKDDAFLTVSQKYQESDNPNFALVDQSVIIELIANNDTLPFLFDSGSQTTTLSSLFFNTYKSDIVEASRKVKVETGSLGGVDSSEAYLLDSLNISVGNSRHKMDSLVVYPVDLSGSDMKYLYGVFGQDYISKFSEMNISFVSMNISFK